MSVGSRPHASGTPDASPTVQRTCGAVPDNIMKRFKPGRYDAIKVCADPDCSLKGQPQASTNFAPIGRSLGGGTVGTCYACANRKRAASEEVKRRHDEEYRRLKALGAFRE